MVGVLVGPITATHAYNPFVSLFEPSGHVVLLQNASPKMGFVGNLSSKMVVVRSAPVRLVPVRFAPVKKLLERLAPERLAPEKSGMKPELILE